MRRDANEAVKQGHSYVGVLSGRLLEALDTIAELRRERDAAMKAVKLCVDHPEMIDDLRRDHPHLFETVKGEKE